MWFLFVAALLLVPFPAFAQESSSTAFAVDDPSFYSPSWTEQDEDLLIKSYIDVFRTNKHPVGHSRVFIWDFIDRTGELINTDHFKVRLQQALSKAFPQKVFIFRGYGSLILNGQIEMNVKQVDGMIYKDYTVWLKAIDSSNPWKQVWSKAITFTHSQMLPDYNVGYIEEPHYFN